MINTSSAGRANATQRHCYNTTESMSVHSRSTCPFNRIHTKSFGKRWRKYGKCSRILEPEYTRSVGDVKAHTAISEKGKSATRQCYTHRIGS